MHPARPSSVAGGQLGGPLRCVSDSRDARGSRWGYSGKPWAKGRPGSASGSCLTSHKGPGGRSADPGHARPGVLRTAPEAAIDRVRLASHSVVPTAVPGPILAHPPALTSRMPAVSKPVVLIAEELSPATVDALGPDFEIRSCNGADRAELLAAITDVDAILVRSATKVDAEALAAAARLKVVARAGVGLDNVDVQGRHPVGRHGRQRARRPTSSAPPSSRSR